MEGLSSILDSVKIEAVNWLLFLKSVQRLEVYQWDSSSAAPTQLFSCCLANGSPDVLAGRRLVSSFSTSAPAHKGSNAESAATSNSYTAIFESRVQAETGEVASTRTFSISQACGGGQSDALAATAAE